MADSGDVGVVGREGEERLDAGLPDQHHQVPPLFDRADEEMAPVTKEDDRAATCGEERHRVSHVPVVRFTARYRAIGRKLRIGGVVRDGSEPKQVQHHDRTGEVPLDEPMDTFV